MSRTRTQTTQTTTEVDKVQQLLDQLNTIAGIEFAEDAWEEKAPNNYGVVELTGETGSDYADGRKTAQNYGVRITIYVTGGSHRWIAEVEGVLDALQIPHTMPQREFLFDIKKVSWVWNGRIRKPVTRTVETPAQTQPGGGEGGQTGV